MDEFDRFNRTERLLGQDMMQRLHSSRIIIFGVGGVGSWTAEALIRTGIGHLTIVDADSVAASNINRQLMALTSTVGQPKAEVLRQRLTDINPSADITAICRQYSADTADEFDLTRFDYVVDAIDSLSDKALLLVNATRQKVKIVSSMGAALKIDPTRIKVGEFRSVKGCRLAAALRNKFKRTGVWPSRKIQCVYSDELLQNKSDRKDATGAMSYSKVAINGAMCHITAIFGMTLAGLVIESLTAATKK